MTFFRTGSVIFILFAAVFSSTAAFGQAKTDNSRGGERKPGAVAAAATGTAAVVAEATSTAAVSERKGEPGSDAQPGDVVINVTSDGGKPIHNFIIRLVFPGADGSLEKLPNLMFQYSDGDKKHIVNDNNGNLRIRWSELKPYVRSGWKYRVEIERKNCVTAKKESKAFSSTTINYKELLLDCK